MNSVKVFFFIFSVILFQNCLSCQELENEDEIFSRSDEVHKQPLLCGLRNIKGVGGNVSSLYNKTLHARFGEFPWMVVVLSELRVGDNIVPIYQSGGTLIHPKIVLTTAHTIANIACQKIIVRAGEWNTQEENEPYDHQELRVTSVIRHDQFNAITFQNDLALLVLESAFEMSDYINTICLPPPDTSFDSQRCLMSGWGKREFNGNHQDILKKVILPIVSFESCQENLETLLSEDYKLDEKKLCTRGENGIGVCAGDEGSPLVCSIASHPNHYYQAGIVAGEVKCGEKNVPSLFADVSKYRNWIDSELSILGMISKLPFYSTSKQ